MVAKKRERERSRKPLHLKRVFAQVKVETHDMSTKILDAKLVLNDISPKGVGLFTSEPVLVGQNVALTLEHPKRIYIKGRIVQCQEFAANSHVMSDSQFAYRINIKFTFASKEDEAEVIKFCDDLQITEIHAKVA